MFLFHAVILDSTIGLQTWRHYGDGDWRFMLFVFHLLQVKEGDTTFQLAIAVRDRSRNFKLRLLSKYKSAFLVASFADLTYYLSVPIASPFVFLAEIKYRR